MGSDNTAEASNTQIQKHTNTQMQKYTNTQIQKRHKYTNTQNHNLEWDQTFEYAAEVPPLLVHPVNKAAAE